MKLSKADLIYEKKGIFGDEKKFKDSNHRLKLMKDIFKKLPLKPEAILDIGCGTGYFTNFLKENFPKAEVIGTDISKKALNLGKEKYKNVEFRFANSEASLPFKNKYFDLIVSAETIPCIKDTDTFLSEISRVSKKGASLMLTTPNLSSWLNRLLIATGKPLFYYEPSFRKTLPLLKIGKYTFPNRDLPPTGLLRVFNSEILSKLLREYDFNIIKVYGVSLLSLKILKPLDLFFCQIPNLATGIILLAVKKETA